MSFSLSAKFQLLNVAQKLSIFKFLFLFDFVVNFYGLSFGPLPAWVLFLIVLHSGVKKDSREKRVICDGEYELQEHGFMASVKTMCGKLLHIFKSHCDCIFPVLITYFCKYFQKNQPNNCNNKKRRKMC